MSDLSILAPTTTTSTATSVVSSAAIDVLGAAMAGEFYFSVVGADVYVIFGSTSALAAASSSNGFPLTAGSREPYMVDSNRRYMRVIAQSGSGSIVHFRVV
jgi:hypothetical protein